ncbi:MAG: hypothetical protein WD469_08860 [Paenibacillaceae bacterium]
MNYEVEVRRRGRVKKVSQRKWLTTVNVNRSSIQKSESDGVVLKAKTAKDFKMKCKSLERAAEYFYNVRTLTKDEKRG